MIIFAYNCAFVLCRFLGPFNYAFVFPFKPPIFNKICTEELVCDQATICISIKVNCIDIPKNGPRQANLVLIAYASSEGSGEPAHPRSLARTFAARSYKQRVKRNLQTESQIPGPSEWLGMRS